MTILSRIIFLALSAWICLWHTPFVLGQQIHVPYHKEYYHLLDRYELKLGYIPATLHSAFKPIYRSAWVQLADSGMALPALTDRDQFNLEYLLDDSYDFTSPRTDVGLSKKPIWGLFYKHKNAFLDFDSLDIQLLVNPVLHVGIGAENQNLDVSFGDRIAINTRGAEIRGILGRKLAFYSIVTENQIFAPFYVDAYRKTYRSLPGEGFIKPFATTGYDFISARGYISFDPIRRLNLQFGHDKLFLGNGYRSLMLSDFSENQLYARANATFWKVNYVVHFSELVAGRNLIGPRLPKKYLGMHHLSVNLGKRWNVSFFESIVFGGTDTLGRTTFEPKYLNPVIFYRFVEQQSGSADNALLGVHIKYNPGYRLSFFGAVVIDEFKISDFRARNGWWGNKQAFQVGAKWVDAFGLSHLDLHGEVNYIRPYMYTHFNNNNSNPSYTSYSHPLAHPLGANLYELLGVVRYQPTKRLWVTAKAFVIQIGLDSSGTNWGSDPRADYRTRERDLGNTMLQGVRSTILRGDLLVTYMLKHNLFLDAALTYRQQRYAVRFTDHSGLVATLGLRLNMPYRWATI
jgi:hypothetical protein